MPIKKLTIVKLNIPVGIAAAKASEEYQDRNIRSTNCWIDQDPGLSMSGNAISSTGRYPLGLDQRFASECLAADIVTNRSYIDLSFLALIGRPYRMFDYVVLMGNIILRGKRRLGNWKGFSFT